MNLLCLLFGIDCRAKDSTRSRFEVANRSRTGIAEYDNLSQRVREMLHELDAVDVAALTLDQLQQALQALTAGNALRAAILLTYLIRERLVTDNTAAVVALDEERSRLEQLADQRLQEMEGQTPGLGTGSGIA